MHKNKIHTVILFSLLGVLGYLWFKQTGNIKPGGFEPHLALMILGGFLRNGFLHRAIREQGGAYGGGAGYDSNACAFRFFSYRDPRLAETFADFKKSGLIRPKS